MDARRILVANELTSYRQTIAFVFRELHPGVEVLEADPETLDGEVARLVPDLVICSRVTVGQGEGRKLDRTPPDVLALLDVL